MPLGRQDRITHNNKALYALMDDTELRGGAISVPAITDRTAIPLDKRKQYMIVSCDNGSGTIITTRYKSSDLSNPPWVTESNWEEIGGGGGYWTQEGDDIYYAQGKVGINDTTPSSLLSIKSSAVDTIVFDIQRSGGANQLLRFYETAAGDGALQIGKIDNAAMIRLDSNGNSYFNGGNVGIGTITPAYAVTISRTNNTTALELRIDNVGDGYQSALNFTGKNAGGTYDRVAIIRGYQTTNADSGHLRFYTKASGGTAAEKVRIDSNGNVGIGVTTPTSLLHIYKYQADTIMSLAGSADNWYLKSIYSTKNFELANNSGTKFAIDVNGNVGIGITLPQGQLDVTSTTGALIVPRMSTSQRTSLAPISGTIVYDYTENNYYGVKNGTWRRFDMS